MQRPYVLTGAGLISAAGDTPQDLFQCVRSGMVLAGSLHTLLPQEAFRNPDEPLPDFPIAPIRRFDPEHYLKRKGLQGLSRTSLLAVTASSRLAQRIANVPPADVGIVHGSAWGSFETIVALEHAVVNDGPRAVDPLLFTESRAIVPVGQVAAFFGWSSWGATISAGSASGLEAVRFAIDRLDEGRARVAVAGGVDALNLPILRALWAQQITADMSGSFPYAADRSGPVGGEGACLVVVESEESARRREVLPLASIAAVCGSFWVSGSGASPPSRAALVHLLRRALDEAALTPQAIGLLVLPGNGSVEGDREQARAVIEVFSSGSSAPPAVAPKGTTGETWAASGPIGVVTALEAMRTGTVPGRPKAMAPDPAIAGLNLPRESYDRAIRHALVLEASATGHCTALVLSAWSGRPGELKDKK